MAKAVNVAEFRLWLEELAGKPYEGWEEQWSNVLKALRLGLYYVLPIQELLKLEVWMSKPNPLGYMRKAARKMAKKMGLASATRDRKHEVLACELTEGQFKGGRARHDTKLALALHNYESRHGDGLPEPLERRMSPEVLDATWEGIDWDRVAAMADLDEGERTVLEMRRVGFTRPVAMKACLCDCDRKVLRAAWRRLERRRLAIRNVIKTGKPETARRLETRERWQMCLMEMEDGAYRIFFKTYHGDTETRRTAKTQDL